MANDEYPAKSMNQRKATLSLRPWKLDDLDNLVKFANNKKIADNQPCIATGA